ncbi:MAG: ABC transporter ATP-binding protein, partial [Clostridia bacterium]|nr:ABC transporter ATP-binding protein [Clostridia bacterium]
MIEVKNLTKRYGDKLAVDNISFTVKEGEIVGFLGPNGAGKSTTMNILTGYLSATEGEVTINGFDILEEPYMAKKNIGFLPEIAPLYMDMTVKEYLNFVCDLKKCTLDREKHLKEICELVSIVEVYNRVIKNLSKGYKQRVGFAQALVGNPPVLILDEPTVGFDPRQIIEIRNLIKNLGKKHTVILSSHILSEVQATCQRVIVINKGKLIANDSPDKLSSQINDKKQITVVIEGPSGEVQKALSESGVFKSVMLE